MEILIFSDSHGRTEGMRAVLSRQVSPPSAVMHLGDGVRDTGALALGEIPLYMVRGNCDGFLYGVEGPVPEECLTSIGGHLFFLTHGARYGVKGGLGGLLRAALQKGADIVLFGHTHRPYLEILPAGAEAEGQTLTRPVYLFNPGSIGQGGERTFGMLTLKDGAVLFSHGVL